MIKKLKKEKLCEKCKNAICFKDGMTKNLARFMKSLLLIETIV